MPRAGSRRSCFPPTPRPSPWSPWGCVQPPAQWPSAHWAPVPSGSSPALEPPSEQSGSHPQPSLTCGSYVRCGGGRGPGTVACVRAWGWHRVCVLPQASACLPCLEGHLGWSPLWVGSHTPPRSADIHPAQKARARQQTHSPRAAWALCAELGPQRPSGEQSSQRAAGPPPGCL